MGKKKPQKPICLRLGDMVAFRVYTEDYGVKVESGAADWSVFYARDTYPALMILKLISTGNLEGLRVVLRTVFMSNLFFSYPKMIPPFYAIIEDAMAATDPIETGESQEDILAEQKVLHDPTPENIAEHQKLINNE